MNKKFLTATAMTAAVAVCAFTFTACGKDSASYSETYEGTVSEQSYASSTLAAQAFLSNEISCASETATFVSYNKTGDLSQKEIDALSLSESERASVVSAEKGSVAYTVAPSSTSEVAAASATEGELTYYKGVYVLDMGETYKYYDPAPANGEALTNSYYESVFNPANYENCTMTMKTISKSSAQGQSTTLTIEYCFKITENAVSLELTNKISASGKSQSNTICIYIVETDDTIKAAVLSDGNYTVVSASELAANGLNITEIEDIAKMSVPEYIDVSFFEKTASGFKMKADKVDEYLDSYLTESGLSSLIENLPFTWKVDYNFFVSEGKLSKVSSACTINMRYQGVSAVASASAECKYTDYGTTTVTLPDGAKAALGITA